MSYLENTFISTQSHYYLKLSKVTLIFLGFCWDMKGLKVWRSLNVLLLQKGRQQTSLFLFFFPTVPYLNFSLFLADIVGQAVNRFCFNVVILTWTRIDWVNQNFQPGMALRSPRFHDRLQQEKITYKMCWRI